MLIGIVLRVFMVMKIINYLHVGGVHAGLHGCVHVCAQGGHARALGSQELELWWCGCW